MTKKITFILLAALLAFGLTACNEGSGEKAGKNVSEKKIVAGTVAAAQYLNALDVDVAAIPTTEKNLPERYKGKPEIGLPMTPNLELVLAADPDIFVADSTMKATLEEMFYGKNIELVLLDNNSFDSISSNIELLAEKLGVSEKAKQVIEEIEKKKREAMAKAKGKQQPKAAIIFGTTAMFMLATDSSCVGSMIDMLGAKNVTDESELRDPYVTFDREKLAELNPDIILRLSHADPAETAKAFEAEFSKPFWQQIKAVQNKRVYDLDITHFGVTANFDTVEAPMLLAQILYGK